jgi:hypothetical protein
MILSTHTESVDGHTYVVKVLAPVSREQSLRQHRMLPPATKRDRKPSDMARLLAGEGNTFIDSLRIRISSDGIHQVAQN